MDTAHDRLSVREYGASPGSHAHGHFQMLVGLAGVLELEVDGRGQRIGAGDACLVRPGQRHDFEADRISQCLVLDSDQPLWARCATAPGHPQQVRALASYLAQAMAGGSPLAAVHGPSLLLEAWAPSLPQASRPRRRIDWPALAAWVQLRLHEAPSVEALAQQALLSTSQFALRCHESQGMSPQRWLQQQRLARARQLRALGLPVAEVARRTGYRSPSALTAALRRDAGH